LLPYSVIESLPVFSAARAIPDLPTLIFSAYCNGMRGDFHPAGLGDRGEVNVERREIRRRSDAGRMPAHLIDKPLRHPYPLRHTFEDRRNAPGI
jgi:hypothetical protein